jgi:ubiquinone biosynthesis protein COQ9
MTQARDQAILAALPAFGQLGWTEAALRQGAGANADLLFPGGPADMVEAYIALADRRMVAQAAPDLPALGLAKRVRHLIATRLSQSAPEKPAIRRAMAVLARPGNTATALRCTANTVDTIWHAAGDTSADFSWYTKRAILAGVYTSTLVFWLGPAASEDATLDFLDRRLAGVAKLGRLRKRLTPARPLAT